MAIAEELQVVIRAEVDKAMRDLGRFDQSVDRTEGRMRKFGESAGRIGKTLSASLTLPLLAAGTAAVKFAADIERQETAFGVLLEDVERGTALFEELKTFSAETPLQLSDITKASQTLLAFGTNAEDVQEQIRMIGDVAQGQAEKLDRIALAFGKIQARGRVSMEEINVLIEAGVPIISELANNMGIAESAVFDFVSSGKIGFTEIEGALKSLTSEGGQFEGMMEKISQTTAGKFSTALDNLKLAAAELGAEMLPMVNELLDRVTEVAKWFGELDDGTKKLIISIGGLAAASGPIMMAVGGLIKLKTVIMAINTTVLFGPIGIIAGITAAAGALVLLGKRNREAHLEEIAAEFGDIESAAGMATEKIEDVEHALNLGMGHGLADAAEDVKMISRELGISEQAVIDIGLASKTVTGEYEDQLQALKDQFVEQTALNALMEDQWLARERGQEAADARARAMMERREAEAEALAEARAEIQERADEAYAAIERRLEEINRLEEFNLSIGEEYNAEEERRRAILEETNMLIADGVRLNTSYSGALDYILDRYEDILKKVEEVNDETGEGAGGDDIDVPWSPEGLTEYGAALIEAEQKAQEARREEMRKSAEAAARYRQAELDTAVAAQEAMTDAMAEYENASPVSRDVETGVDDANWIKIGNEVADAFGDMLAGEDSGIVMAIYDAALDVGESILNMYAPGLGSLARKLRDIWNDYVLFPILDWAAGLVGIDSDLSGDEDTGPTAEERRADKIEALNEILDEELRIRNDAMRELNDRFDLEFDVLRDQWERNLIDTEQFVSGMGELGEEYSAEEAEINSEVQRIREILEDIRDGTSIGKALGEQPRGWMQTPDGSQYVNTTNTSTSATTVVNINGEVFGENAEEMIYEGLQKAQKRGRIAWGALV